MSTKLNSIINPNKYTIDISLHVNGCDHAFSWESYIKLSLLIVYENSEPYWNEWGCKISMNGFLR